MVHAVVKRELFPAAAVDGAVVLLKGDARGIKSSWIVAISAPGRYQKAHILFVYFRIDLLIIQPGDSDAEKLRNGEDEHRRGHVKHTHFYFPHAGLFLNKKHNEIHVLGSNLRALPHPTFQCLVM